MFLNLNVRWLMADQVDGIELGELLHEYIEREEEVAMLADGVELSGGLGYSARYPRPPLFKLLTSLTISEPLYHGFLEDSRVISYVLTHARQLKELRLEQMEVNMDEAFTCRLIGAPLKKLDLSFTNITDVTIDVLCQQLAPTLRSLALNDCDRLTSQGFIRSLIVNGNNSHK